MIICWIRLTPSISMAFKGGLGLLRGEGGLDKDFEKGWALRRCISVRVCNYFSRERYLTNERERMGSVMNDSRLDMDLCVVLL